MLSKALGKYPEYRFQNDEKRLWNPIQKKMFADLPEERVRLSLVEYLTQNAGLSSSRISFESPVKLQADKTSSRTDLIYYDKDFEPELLIECKAPDIKLTEKAAVQIARYNEKVNARYLMISNGLTDHWFEKAEGDIKNLGEIPDQFRGSSEVEIDIRYWESKLFIGHNTDNTVKENISGLCEKMFSDPFQPVKYLNFEGYPAELSLNHYYRIFGMDQDKKLAVSFSANYRGETRFNVILNVKGANIGFATSLVTVDGFDQSEIHSGKGIQKVDLNEIISLKTDMGMTRIAQKLSELLTKYS